MFPSAPLLPKLRGHFAEFLNKGSPVRLRILTSPTCVGLRYGRLFDIPATFLASVKSHASLLEFRSLFGSGCVSGVLHYQTPSLWKPRCPSPGSCYPSVSLHHSQGGAGISTCCPSPTTSVLGLGPDLPWADEPSPGNLRLSTGKFLACLSLLIPAFSLESSPLVLSLQLLP